MSKPVDADRIFSDLDGTQLSVGESRWCVRVYGVVDQASGRWVEIGLDGSRQSIVTIHVEQTKSAPAILRCLRSWLKNPGACTSVLIRLQPAA